MRPVAKKIISAVLIAIFFSGCAASRGIVNIQIPQPSKAKQLNGQSIFINSVTDARVFEQNPKLLDIPSVGSGGENTAPADLKKRAIARERNIYGKALGNILLPENKSVESVIRASLARSFSEAGYEVITSKDRIKATTLVLDTSIDKFWSWMKPGISFLTLTSEIKTTITVKNDKTAPKEIYVTTEGHFQSTTEEDWLKIMNKSLEAYNVKVKEQFSPKGL